MVAEGHALTAEAVEIGRAQMLRAEPRHAVGAPLVDDDQKDVSLGHGVSLGILSMLSSDVGAVKYQGILAETPNMNLNQIIYNINSNNINCFASTCLHDLRTG